MSKIIPLTKRKEAIVDDGDFERVSKHKWWRWANGYAAAYINGKLISMHRFILGAVKGDEIDHINMNKLDCRRENLRKCTRGQNVMNTRVRSDNLSGYKGVTFVKNHGKYSAHIRIKTRLTHLGYFDTAEEAAHIYDAAAKKHFGEFARVNFESN